MDKGLINFFNKFILCAAIIFNFLLIILFIYLIKNHSFLFNIISISIFLAFFLFYLLVFIYFNEEWKTVVSICSLTILVSLLLSELYLSFSPKFNHNLAIEKRSEQAKLIEPRTKIEFINDLISNNIESVPVIPPIIWRKSLDDINSNTANYSKKNNIFPLSGISNKLTVNCNELGYWSTYNSDKHGFNNPNESYEVGLDVVTIGDSFTHGACVKEGEDIASQLRNLDLSVLNFGYGGNGPLIELATLVDYATQYKPKNVLWFYHRGDIFDLFLELKNEILIKYLEESFSQNLINRQKEIDDFLIKYLEKEVLYFNNKSNIQKNNEKSSLNNFISFFKLSNIRKLFNLYDTKYLCLDYFCDQASQEEFSKIIKTAKNKTENWGGKFYFVYLPSWEEYTNNKPFIKNKKEIIKIVEKENINLIDFHDVLKNKKDPLEYFAFKLPNHYTSEGYNLVSKQIYSHINSDL